MCYVCGKSRRKIVHTPECRYVKLIPEKNKKHFRTLKDASVAGYTQCKYCSYIMGYLRNEKDQVDHYCKANGLYYSYNETEDTLDIISKSGKWKIIVNGQKHFIWLYHENRKITHSGGLVPGYHSQNTRSSTIMGYMQYIVKHDRYREENPLYEYQKHTNTVKGSKKWKKDQRRAERVRRARSIRYVEEILANMSAGIISY